MTKGNAKVLRISKAALFAAALSFSAAPAIGLGGALAQDIVPVALTTTAAGAVSSAPASSDDGSSDSTMPASPAEGLSFDVSIPTVQAVDSSMDEAALRDALSGKFAEHATDLAKLTATSITIPELTLTTKVTIEGKEQTTVASYKNIVLSNVKDGVAGTVAIDSATSSNAEGSFSFGKMSVSNQDFGTTLAIFGLVPGTPGDTTMKPLYKGFSIDSAKFTSPQVSCDVGKISVGDFSARPLKVSFKEMMDAIGDTTRDGKPDPKALRTVVGFITDLFQAMQSDPTSLDGMTCTGQVDSAHSFNFSMGGLTMDGYAPGIYPALSVKDLSYSDSANDKFSLAAATFKAIDLHGPFAALESAPNLDDAWFATNYRQLIPAFGGLSFSGLSFDLPVMDEGTGGRSTGKVGDFDLSLSDYLNGIPTKLSIKSSGVETTLPANSDDATLRMLQVAGITSVNLNYEITAAWDKDTQSINIEKVSLSGNDLGSIAVAAVIGGAGPALFDSDFNTEMAAAATMTLKSLKIDTVDSGMGDKLWPLMAQSEGADPAAYRAKAAAVAEGGVIATFGAKDSARQLATALSDFISGAKKALTVTVNSVDPAGIPFPVLEAASEDPTALGAVADVSGSAQ